MQCAFLPHIGTHYGFELASETRRWIPGWRCISGCITSCGKKCGCGNSFAICGIQRRVRWVLQMSKCCALLWKKPPKMASLQIMAENLEFVAFLSAFFIQEQDRPYNILHMILGAMIFASNCYVSISIKKVTEMFGMWTTYLTYVTHFLSFSHELEWSHRQWFYK